MSPLVGAIDEGTSSARFIIFEAESTRIVASHQEPLTRHFPQEGWVEQDPVEILTIVHKCIEGAVAQLIAAGGSVRDIAAIGITNQRESTIVWDRLTGKPLHNSIVWLDMRTASTVDQLLDKVPNKTRNKNYLKPLCGLPLSPYFSAVKLKWLLDNVPRVAKASSSNRLLFGTVDTWLIWNLTRGYNLASTSTDDSADDSSTTAVHVTDVSNASRTMLMNIDTLRWDPVLLAFFGTPTAVLPEIRSSSEVYGKVRGGPLDGVRIAGCLGDQMGALVGQQCMARGQAKATYGTGCFLLYNTGSVRVDSGHGLLTTVAYQLGAGKPPVYALEGSVAVAGAAFAWLRDNLDVLPEFGDAQLLAEEAADVEAGEVVFVPAFSGLYAPYWCQDARGVICGITADTHSSHIVKATMDALCFQTRDILNAMNKDYGSNLQKLQVDGGVTSNSALMQLQADITGVTMVKPSMAECTALGAAMVAGSAVGVWNLKTSAQNPPLQLPTRQWKPTISANERDVRYARWKMAIERSMGWDT